jgi:hypothetical protein
MNETRSHDAADDGFFVEEQPYLIAQEAVALWRAQDHSTAFRE